MTKRVLLFHPLSCFLGKIFSDECKRQACGNAATFLAKETGSTREERIRRLAAWLFPPCAEPEIIDGETDEDDDICESESEQEGIYDFLFFRKRKMTDGSLEKKKNVDISCHGVLRLKERLHIKNRDERYRRVLQAYRRGEIVGCNGEIVIIRHADVEYVFSNGKEEYARLITVYPVKRKRTVKNMSWKKISA